MRDQKKRELDEPEYDVTGSRSASVSTIRLHCRVPYHSLSCYTHVARDVVLDFSVRRPDSLDHDSHGHRAIGGHASQPKNCQDATRDDAEVAEVLSERRSNDDGERDVQIGTDSTIENHGN